MPHAAVFTVQVDKILTPGLRPGAADVFLDFLSYSSGPLPEQQLEEVTVPVSILWGDKDPWEKVRSSATNDAVTAQSVLH